MRHKISINVIKQNDEKENVIRGNLRTLPKRLLKLIFGETADILVIAPGKSVEAVEIHEIQEGGITQNE